LHSHLSRDRTAATDRRLDSRVGGTPGGRMPLTSEQIQARMGALGGSDCAAALGVSRFKTARQLFYEKRGEWPRPVEESLALRLGNAFEPVVRDLWAEDRKLIVRQPEGTLAHPKHPLLIAHLDGFTGSGPTLRGYEGKLALRSVGWGLEGTDQIPLDAYFQTQHYMLVTGIEAFDVVCLLGWRLKTYEVLAEPELQRKILARELEFIERLHENDPPPLDYEHKTALAFVKQLYPGTNGKRVMATEELIFVRMKLMEAQAVEAAAHREVEACKARLLEAQGEAALLVFDDGKSYRRKLIERPAYAVPALQYVEARFVNTPKETAP
jgi:predicted phage-related endonuclease